MGTTDMLLPTLHAAMFALFRSSPFSCSNRALCTPAAAPRISWPEKLWRARTADSFLMDVDWLIFPATASEHNDLPANL